MAQFERTDLDIDNLPALLTVGEAARLIRVESGTAYRMIERGDLPVVRFGGTLRVPSRALLAKLVENSK